MTFRFLANADHVTNVPVQSFEASVKDLHTNPATVGVSHVQLHALRPHEVSDEISETVTVSATEHVREGNATERLR